MMKRATFIGMGIGSSLILFTRCGLGANPVSRENSTSSHHVNGLKNEVYSSLNSASGDNPVTGSGMSMKSIDMESTHVGWAVTTTGIMRTNDGGVYWKHVLALPNGGDIRTDFMSASEAVIAIDTPGSSAPASLFMTSDGGNHWTQRVLPTTGVTNLSFIRPGGWIMSDPSGLSMGSEHVLLFRTQDDGVNWVKIAVSTSLPSPHTMPDSGVKNGMLFTSSNVGFVSVGGPDARLYRTSDSGLHWDRINLPKMHVSSGLAGTVSEPVFFDPSHGIVSSLLYRLSSRLVGHIRHCGWRPDMGVRELRYGIIQYHGMA